MLKVDKTARFVTEDEDSNLGHGLSNGLFMQVREGDFWAAGKWHDLFKTDWRYPTYCATFARGTASALRRASLDGPVRIEGVKELGNTEEYLRPKYRSFDLQAWWWFRGVFYTSAPALTGEDVHALLLETENKQRLRLERAHALMAMRQQLDTKAKRQPIPQEVRVLVWQRDFGRCAECGSQRDLEYDHIIPLSMGGSNTERNLQLLCATCNRRKGASLG